ncbi:hypothetical protein RCL1_006700 [Eukaryota sp. TZLM3-RCL]
MTLLSSDSTCKRLSSSLDDVPSTTSAPPLKISQTPAKTYPFQLDEFQRNAIDCISRQESVLVAAHTSAGKTVVAEYAIAQSLKNKQRVVYTSPIKALSNQKFRDFQKEFVDVGLMTGDVTQSPNAACLVMTTEILRSMLYRGSEVVKELAWVVFDEVHYLRDKERGVVWEETLVLLPSSVRFVFLSATIPNADEFGSWVMSIHKQPITIISTEFRPVPLEHYVMPHGSACLFQLVDANGVFHEDRFSDALSKLGDKTTSSSIQDMKRSGGKGKKMRLDSELNHLMKQLTAIECFPVIIFSFSRAQCERNAMSLKNHDLTNFEEKQQIKRVFELAISTLAPEDRELTAIKQSLLLLQQGIGIHHAGLFPIIKEITELLFGEGLVKILVATETFSMGLNMPARTVVFTDIVKFDGTTERLISSGEYIQMSGRAGRRGKDTRGYVIVMLNDKMDPVDMKDLMKGQSLNLDSTFHLRYNMVLNTLRIEETSAENLIEKSFLSYQKSRKIPVLEGQIEKIDCRLKEITDTLSSSNCDLESLETLHLLADVAGELYSSIKKIVMKPEHFSSFLTPGRFIKVGMSPFDSNPDPAFEYGWGLLIEHTKEFNIGLQKEREEVYTLKMLLYVDPDETIIFKPRKLLTNQNKRAEIVPIKMDKISAISTLKLPLSNISVDNPVNRLNTLYQMDRLLKVNGELPVLNPMKDMRIEPVLIEDTWNSLQEVENELKSHPYYNNPEVTPFYDLFKERIMLTNDRNLLVSEIKHSEKVVLQAELKGMRNVLKALGYIDEEGITTKGRIAAEISTGDELVLSALMLDGTLSNLSGPEVCAILSCFVNEERTPKEGEKKGKKKEIQLSPQLKQAFEELRTKARSVAEAQRDAGLDVNPDEFVEKFNTLSLGVALDWASGSSFKALMEKHVALNPKLYEGNVIRMLKRLDELLKQLIAVSKSLCSEEMDMKFSAASKCVKRGIVSSSSLYI